jgi:hypothetical protein
VAVIRAGGLALKPRFVRAATALAAVFFDGFF